MSRAIELVSPSYVSGCCHIMIEWDRRKGGRLSVSGLLVQYLYIPLHTQALLLVWGEHMDYRPAGLPGDLKTNWYNHSPRLYHLIYLYIGNESVT